MRETTRQVVCRSNVRQLGFGIAMFANEHYLERLPHSVYGASEAQRTIEVRRDDDPYWDGLGFLYSQEYLVAQGVFYCPSHTGPHPLRLYDALWPQTPTDLPLGQRQIIVNYQYRGGAPLVNGRIVDTLAQLPGRIALVSDALNSRDDMNHMLGTNLLRADMSASWYPDPGRHLFSGMPEGEADPAASDKVMGTWGDLDHPGGEPPQ